jgi:hypothetical protein
VSWLVAGGAFFGGTLFVIGSFCGIAPQIYNTAVPKTGLTNAYAWLVLFTFFVGTYFFTMGCALLYVESCNADYPDKMAAWQARGCKGPKPKYRFFGFYPGSFAWWGGVIYTVGAVLYNVGSTANLALQFATVNLIASQTQWISTFTFCFGGFYFLFAGACYVWQEFGVLGMWRGIFVPLKKAHWVSLDWWINMLNWWGGVGFCMSGVFLYYPTISFLAYQIEAGIGYGVGSFCFWLGGLLLYIKMTLPKAELPVSVPPQMEVDDEGNADMKHSPVGANMELTPSAGDDSAHAVSQV